MEIKSLYIKEYNDELIRLYDRLIRLLENGEYKGNIKEFEDIFESEGKKDRISIAVVGEYSTGKSSIISALTGDKSIEIDSDVKTDKAKLYQFNGFDIVDTPGLLSGYNEHTKIAYDAIERASIIIFCITTSLFSQASLNEIVEILKSPDKRERTIICINKIDMDATRKNPIDEMADRDESVRNILKQKNIEYSGKILQFSAKLYIEDIKKKEQDYIDRSYFEQLIDFLNGDEFENSFPGLDDKCYNRLSKMLNFIEDIYEKEEKKLNDYEKRRILEIKNEKKKEIDNCYFAIINEIRDKFNRVQEIIMKQIDGIVDTGESEDTIKTNFLEIFNYENQCGIRIIEDYCVKEIKSWDTSQSGDVILKDICIIDDKKISKIVKKRKKGFKIKQGWGEKLGKSVSSVGKNVTEWAEPVEKTVKEGFFHKKKKIKSEFGGEGTKLYSNLSKIFKNKTDYVAPKVAKTAKFVSENEMLMSGLGIALEVGMDFAYSARERKEQNMTIELKRYLKRTTYETIKNEIDGTLANIEAVYKEVLRQIDLYHTDNKMHSELGEIHNECKILLSKVKQEEV